MSRGAADGSSSGQQRAAYTVDQKIRLIKQFKNIGAGGTSGQRKFARDNGLKESTFRTWVQEYEKGKLKIVANANNRTRVRKCKYEMVEEKLLTYITHRNSYIRTDGCCGLSWALLQQKAKQFAKQLADDPTIPEFTQEICDSFQASPGWIKTVLERSGLEGHALHGEGGSVDEIKAKNKGKITVTKPLEPVDEVQHEIEPVMAKKRKFV